MFLLCAISTTLAPGPAIAGQPDSDIIPTLFPSIAGFKNEFKSSFFVCLFSTKKVELSISNFGSSFLKYLLVVLKLAGNKEID